MMNYFDDNYRAVELYQCELRAQAEKDRLVRQVRRVRPWPTPRRWRRRAGTALIAAGESLAGPALDVTRQPRSAAGHGSPGCICNV